MKRLGVPQAQIAVVKRTCYHPILVFFGRISYGFYVLHILLEPAYDHLGQSLTNATTGFPYQTARLLVAFAMTSAVAWISYVSLERPFLRLKRWFPQPSGESV